MRPCLSCGTPTPKGSRCPSCAHAYDRGRRPSPLPVGTTPSTDDAEQHYSPRTTRAGSAASREPTPLATSCPSVRAEPTVPSAQPTSAATRDVGTGGEQAGSSEAERDADARGGAAPVTATASATACRSMPRDAELEDPVDGPYVGLCGVPFPPNSTVVPDHGCRHHLPRVEGDVVADQIHAGSRCERRDSSRPRGASTPGVGSCGPTAPGQHPSPSRTHPRN